MSKHIRRCPEDGQYTLALICPVCGGQTVNAHPARFSPEDRYGDARRAMKLWKTSV